MTSPSSRDLPFDRNRQAQNGSQRQRRRSPSKSCFAHNCPMQVACADFSVSETLVADTKRSSMRTKLASSSSEYLAAEEAMANLEAHHADENDDVYCEGSDEETDLPIGTRVRIYLSSVGGWVNGSVIAPECARYSTVECFDEDGGRYRKNVQASSRHCIVQKPIDQRPETTAQNNGVMRGKCRPRDNHCKQETEDRGNCEEETVDDVDVGFEFKIVESVAKEPAPMVVNVLSYNVAGQNEVNRAKSTATAKLRSFGDFEKVNNAISSIDAHHELDFVLLQEAWGQMDGDHFPYTVDARVFDVLLHKLGPEDAPHHVATCERYEPAILYRKETWVLECSAAVAIPGEVSRRNKAKVENGMHNNNNHIIYRGKAVCGLFKHKKQSDTQVVICSLHNDHFDYMLESNVVKDCILKRGERWDFPGHWNRELVHVETHEDRNDEAGEEQDKEVADSVARYTEASIAFISDQLNKVLGVVLEKSTSQNSLPIILGGDWNQVGLAGHVREGLSLKAVGHLHNLWRAQPGLDCNEETKLHCYPASTLANPDDRFQGAYDHLLSNCAGDCCLEPVGETTQDAPSDHHPIRASIDLSRSC